MLWFSSVKGREYHFAPSRISLKIPKMVREIFCLGKVREIFFFWGGALIVKYSSKYSIITWKIYKMVRNYDIFTIYDVLSIHKYDFNINIIWELVQKAKEKKLNC